jgi:hypothetical protein
MNRSVLTAAVVGALAATIFAGGIAWAAIPDATGVIHGCYKSNNGNLRLVESALDCNAMEHSIDWSQQGPPGPAGTALAYAHVNANGTIDSASANIIIQRVFDGAYCVGVTGGTVHVAVATLDARANVGGSVQTGVYSATDCPESADDAFVVTRPHLQDGGFPGSDRAFFLIVN